MSYRSNQVHLKGRKDIVCLKEVDFVYEFLNMLLPQKAPSQCFSMDTAHNYRLAKEYSLEEEKCSSHCSKYVSDLLEDCSKCRSNLNAIALFVRSASSSSHLSSMFLRPLCNVLKRFLNDSTMAVLKTQVHCKDMASLNNFFIDFKGDLDKTFAFFSCLFRYDYSRSEIPIHQVEAVWNSFIEELKSGDNLDLPASDLLYKELTLLLGKYFGAICSRGQLFAGNDTQTLSDSGSIRSFQSSLGSFQQQGSLFLAQRNNITGSYTNEETVGAHLPSLWTQKLEDDLLLAIRYSEDSKWCSSKVVSRDKTFEQVFNEHLRHFRKQDDGRDRFIFLVELLEHSAGAYKEQFSDRIFLRIFKDNGLKIVLSEIMEFYTFRAFAQPVSDCLENCEADLSDWIQQLKGSVYSVQNRFQSGSSRWDVDILDADKPWLFKLECHLEWQIQCVLDNELLALLDKSLRKCQDMFHTHLMVMNLLCNGHAGAVGMESRKKRLLCRDLMHIYTAVYSVLRKHFDDLIAKKCAQLIKCESLSDVEACVFQWKNALECSLNQSYFPAAVNQLCDLVRKVNASNVCSSSFTGRSRRSSMVSVYSSMSLLTMNQAAPKSKMSAVDKMARQLRMITTILRSAADSTTADALSLEYEIAVLMPRNTSIK